MTKKLSEKQLAARKAQSDRMKAYHAAKKAQLTPPETGSAEALTESMNSDTFLSVEEPEVQDPPKAPVTAHNTTETPTDAVDPQALMPQLVTLTQDQFQQMLDRIAAKPEQPASSDAVRQAFPGGEAPSLDASGRVTGIIERYPINPSFYKSPVEDLYETPELQRFNLRYNWVIEWSVTPTKYQTAMGTWYIEPRFELTLKKKQFDEDNNELIKYDDRGEAYHPRIVWGRASFFEDPPANLLEAELAGLTMDDVDSPDFQEKMRMYRYKFWLIERVSPKAPRFTTSNRREEVIGGKAYEIDNSSKPI